MGKLTQRILVIGNRMPWPLKDGGAMATFGMLEAFQACGADVTYFSYNTKKHWIDPVVLEDKLPGLQVVSVPLDANPSAPQALLNLFSGKSYHLSRYTNSAATAALQLHLQQQAQSQAPYSGIVVEGLYSVPLIAPLLHRPELLLLPIAFRSHNVEHQIWQRVVENSAHGMKKWYLGLQSKRLQNEEEALWKQFSWHFPITQNDAEAIASVVSPALPNIRVYQPGYLQLPPPLDHAWETSDFRCFHIGSMEWEANVQAVLWFVQQVWPQVKNRCEKAEFHIAGKGLKAHDSRFQAPGVVVHGEVADSRLFMREHGVCVVPLLAGSGIRMKILEAMALGLPVLTTNVGIQGIQVAANQEIAVADGAESFAQSLVALLESPVKQEQLALAARNYIEKNHDARGQTLALLQEFLAK